MDANPGLWIRWAKGIASGPAAATRLRRLGYEVRTKHMANGRWTVWSRSPPLEEDDHDD